MSLKCFENRKLNIKKLVDFGFRKIGNIYLFDVLILDGQFKLTIKIKKTGEVSSELIELSQNEIYTLHLAIGANGEFVGKVRAEYEKILFEISDKCFDYDRFKNPLSKKIIEYVKEKYDNEPEYLWEKSPNNAIVRKKDNSKWYLVLLSVAKSKLGLIGDEIIEVIDLRAKPDVINKIVDNKKYFRGYHMNKKNWLTILLDGSVSFREITRRIDSSYDLA